MIPDARFQEDWERAVEKGRTQVLIIECGLLEIAQRQSLHDPQRVWPLMQAPTLAHLREHGPALLDLGGEPFEALQARLDELPRQALIGWMSATLPAAQLASHLGDALACEDDAGNALLIRSYAGEVLPLLHPRTDQPWHPWLFGPLACCWLYDGERWQRLHGLALDDLPAYQPLRLDPPLLAALGGDSTEQRLLSVLEAQLPELLPQCCPGERLEAVRTVVNQARERKVEGEELFRFVLQQLRKALPAAPKGQA